MEYAKKAHQEGWGYVWGTFGQVLTPAIFNQKLKQYPSGVGNYRTFIQNNWLNKKTADCVGLIKSYMWYDEVRKQVRYTSATDINADMMYNRASRKGRISSIPEVPGLCVWRKGHIGVYIGNGWVIEAQGTVHGVKKHRLSNRNFTHWLECPYISYVDEPKKPISKPVEKEKKEVYTLKKIKINVHGKDTSIDGVFYENANYVPIRILEQFGYKVEWNASKGVIEVKYK